jgi:hypothetical protein
MYQAFKNVCDLLIIYEKMDLNMMFLKKPLLAHQAGNTLKAVPIF